MPKKPLEESQYSEPNMSRISCSPTIKQCFWALYPKYSHRFEVLNKQSIDFFVYFPIITDHTEILSPEYLTENRYVHDAYLTNEHWITNIVYMKLLSKIRIFNTNSSEFIRYYPFNDRDRHLRDFAPEEVNFKILKLFST